MTGDEMFNIDVEESGCFGYQADHRSLFRSMLHKAVGEGGGMTIREFLPFKTKQKMPNGKVLWISEKNLYGLVLKENNWIGFDASTVQQMHETNHRTGKPIPREKVVHYKDFPIS